ncbi:MAG: PAS domain S-box protein, partial [Promethearchaeota archaeon]
IINNILDVIVEIDLNGSFTYVSPQSVQMLGYEPKEVIGRKALRYVHPDDLQTVMDAMRKAIENNEHLSFEYRTRHKNGNYIHVSAKGGIINFNGESKIIAVIRDISPKIIAEKKIKESEQHYRKIIESIGDPIQVMDNNLQIIMVNSTFKAWINEYGIDSEILGKTPFELFPFLPKGIVDEYKHVFESGKTLITEESNILNGKTIYTETRKIPIVANGKVTQIVTVLRDITEKKIAQQRLRDSEYHYRYLFENSPDAIVVTDTHGTVLDQNSAVERIFGIPRHKSIGKNFGNFGIFDSEQISLITSRAKKMFNGTIIKPISLKVKDKFGNNLWILHQSSIINMGDEKIIESIIQDITERKKAEEIIKTENKRLLELNKMKTDLVTRVSHELKTPLNSVYGGAQILLSLYRDKTCSEALEFIQMIHKGGERLKILIQNILDISRIESDQLKLKLSRENLSEIIRECIEEIKYLVNLRNIYVQLDLPVEIYLNVDKIRIGQVITNLLSNAIKNTPSKGLIKITLKEVNDNIYISIMDTGVGLTKSDMDKLFKQFGKIERYGQQLDIDIEGSGLGLFISKEIIDLHGGTIWAESEGRNKGATFKIKLFKDNV